MVRPSAALRRVRGAENPEARAWGVWALRFWREAVSALPALSADSCFISPRADGGAPGEFPPIPARREGWDRTPPSTPGRPHPAKKTAAIVPPPERLRLGDWHGLRLVDGVARPSVGALSPACSERKKLSRPHCSQGIHTACECQGANTKCCGDSQPLHKMMRIKALTLWGRLWKSCAWAGGARQAATRRAFGGERREERRETT